MIGPYQAREAENCLWQELFTSPASVHRNGGVLTGSPEVKNGLVLNGTSQYATHAIPGLLAGRSTISFEGEFHPDTDYDADALVNLWSTTSDDYRVYKTNNAGGNKLGIVLGGTLIEEVLSSAYSAAWRVGARNVLIISTNGASTDAWLNGTQILTTDATAWTPTNPAALYTGALADGSGKLDGVFKHIKIRARTIVQADVDALQTDSLYTYHNRAAVWLDMKESTERGGLKQTLDKSPHGRTCLLGDGSTASTIPEFLNPGFLFDAATDHLTLPPDPTGTFTVAWKRANEDVVFESGLVTWNQLNTAGGFEGRLEYLAYWDFELSPIMRDDLSLLWRGNR